MAEKCKVNKHSPIVWLSNPTQLSQCAVSVWTWEAAAVHHHIGPTVTDSDSVTSWL